MVRFSSIRVWVLLLVPVVTGCAANYVPLARDITPVDPAPAPTVYLVNPELEREAAILRMSGLYEFTDDSTHPLQLTLNPMQVRLMEGMPYLISIFTLGIVPVRFQDRTIFSYSIDGSDGVTEREYSVVTEEHYSVWQWFHRRHSPEHALARAIAIAASSQ